MILSDLQNNEDKRADISSESVPKFTGNRNMANNIHNVILISNTVVLMVYVMLVVIFEKNKANLADVVCRYSN